MSPGRPRKIDREQAIADAMRLFWERGLEQTSIQDLVEATGLQRGSIYREFGDKRGLFVATLCRYLEQIEARPWGVHDDPLDELEALLRFTAILGADMPSSCLITNTMLEVGARDAEVASITQRGVCMMESAARELLEAAARLETLAPGATPEGLARLCVTTMQGFRVLSGSQSAAQAEQTVKIFMQLIRGTS